MRERRNPVGKALVNRQLTALASIILAVLIAGGTSAIAESGSFEPPWSSEVDFAIRLFENGNAQGAVQRLTHLADSGDADAQFLLGRFYEGELGIDGDFCRSLQRYREAAAQEHAAAITSVGAFHVTGYCTRQDDGQAAHLFMRAARLGDGAAAFALSILHMSPESDLYDPDQAVAWAERSWELKQSTRFRDSLVVNPAILVGSFYAAGYRVPIDLKKAERYLLSSARQGSPVGQYLLGEFYLDHPAHSRHGEAWDWLFLSASQGNALAAKLIGNEISQIDDDERVKARNAADQAFDRMITDPRLELGRAAKWCFEHRPGSKECSARAYEQHYRCSPELGPTYFETRYVKSLAYRLCREALFDAHSVVSDG